ncbi:MAG: GNAT family N-acetyltransferase [Clostridia bacterium]|nr:GNAT family N-acetyltransferase [Clostridia bacterium]
MPLKDIDQPEIIQISDTLRLRRYDGHYEKLLPGYQTPYVYQNSEGIFDETKIPDMNYVRGMCRYLDSIGELYFIEVTENGEYISIGDVTVKDENPPIAIWEDRFRGQGIGKSVMQAVIRRLKTLGYKKITGSEVFKWNTASQKLHESLGFSRVGEDGDSYIYEYILK